MNNRISEAVVVTARCQHTKKLFGIRVEKRSDRTWFCNWAFPLSEQSAENEGFGSTPVSGNVVCDVTYPGCPYCRAGTWCVCGGCGRLNCYGNETVVQCAWCGARGETSLSEAFELRGGGY